MRHVMIVATALALAACLGPLGLAQQQPPPQQPPAGPLARRDAPMPTQKQSLDYFLGRWTFKWIGAESPLGPGPRSGTLTFVALGDGFLEGRTEAKSEDGPYRETAMVGWNEDRKLLVWVERRPGNVEVVGFGDWTSPIAIRFTLAPIKLKGQTFRIKRTIAVISASSFSLTEEWSVEGGPFRRLGNAVYTKASS